MLEAFDLQKSYNHKTNLLHVLRGVSLKVKDGDFLSIVGPSGAGKSTLLHILGGLDRPNGGKVVLDNEEIYALGDRERANLRNRKIGFVFQFYHLLPEFSALENVILPYLIRGDMANRKEAEDKGQSLLEKVGLKARVTHRPNQLSGGEQQRVAIARALVNDPEIIFCDEPTGNLDSQSGKEVIELLSQLNKKNGQTLVIVTHDEKIATLSAKTVRMQDGRLLN